MAQITLYIDAATQARLRDAASQQMVSQSQFVADLIRRATDNVWSPQALALFGSDPDFPLADELRAGLPPELERDI
ncbi:MAG: CopG family transcriptional regulator [Betaproteobacteria bacterium]|nr:CopG family transcriptional regulator [Betaproteobacteria bacterium]